MEPSFNIGLKNGILEPKHFIKMGGHGYWLFSWLVDKETKESNGIGKVLGGKPIKYSEYKDELPFSRDVYVSTVDRLRRHKYIKTLRTPYGLVISINNSKKRCRQMTHQMSPNDTSPTPNDTSNKTIQRQYSKTAPKGALSPKDKFMRIWNEDAGMFEDELDIHKDHKRRLREGYNALVKAERGTVDKRVEYVGKAGRALIKELIERYTFEELVNMLEYYVKYNDKFKDHPFITAALSEKSITQYEEQK